MISGVIFDCDGTIVDSRHLILPFYRWVFEQVGLPPIDTSDPMVIAYLLSRSDEEVFERFAGEAGQRERLITFLHGLDPADFVSEMQLEPYALEVLTELRPAHRLAIATNRGPDMHALVRHFEFDRYLDTVVTAADVEHPKPYPDMLLLAAERMGLPAEDVLFVGDTPVDEEAAEAAGMPFLCYQRRSEEPPGFAWEPRGDGCLRDLRELPPRIHEMNGPAG